MNVNKTARGSFLITMARSMGTSECLDLIVDLEQAPDLTRQYGLNGMTAEEATTETMAVFTYDELDIEFVCCTSHHPTHGFTGVKCRFELKPMCGLEDDEYIDYNDGSNIEDILKEQFHLCCQSITDTLDSEDWEIAEIRYILPIPAEQLSVSPSQYMALIQRGKLIAPDPSVRLCNVTGALETASITPERIEVVTTSPNYVERILTYAITEQVNVPNEKGPLVQIDALVFEVHIRFLEHFNTTMHSHVLTDAMCEEAITANYNMTVCHADFHKMKENLRLVMQSSESEDAIRNMRYALEMVEKYHSIHAINLNPDMTEEEWRHFRSGIYMLQFIGVNPISLPKSYPVDVVANPLKHPE